MDRNISIDKNLITFGIPVILLGTLVLLMKSPIFVENDSMSLAVTVDLLIVVPLVYFFLIRKREIPKTTVVPLMIIGLVIGTYFLPEANQGYLKLFKNWALPVIEISVLTFIAIKLRSAILVFKLQKGKSPDFYTTLKRVCGEIVPKKLILPFSTEIAVFYYGFIHWKSTKLQNNEYTYHKNSGTPALFWTVILLIVTETIALHFLLGIWSALAAWILTGLSVYSAIQIFGFAKSLTKRPIAINEDSLSLKYGILNEVEISFSSIDTIELSTKPLKKDVLTKTLSPLGELESHNVVIHLKIEKELIGLYGMKNNFKTLGLYVDEPSDFVDKIQDRIGGKFGQKPSQASS